MEETIFKKIRAEAGRDYCTSVNIDKLTEQYEISHEDIYAMIRRSGYKYGLKIGQITKAGLFVKPC